MLYLYVGGVIVALVNAYFITRKFPLASLLTPVVILALAVGLFPKYANAVIEIDADRYSEINAIMVEVKDDQSALTLKNIITETMKNEKISNGEYDNIKTAYAEYKQTGLKKTIAKNGDK